ncbi:MAG: hypothetical protein FJZ85_00115 [Chloroflexi bacterium]|nr:hypothetical protein [Chloroflexota bacterium]
MKRYMNYVAVILLLILVAGMLVGCIKVVRKGEPAATPAPVTPASPPPSGAPETPGGRPVVNSFSASPETVYQGQSVTLSWNVVGANTVVIQPYIGTVQQVGSQVLPLSSSTTFTLTATNSSGSTTGTITVAVKPPAAGIPDLTVTDIWFIGDTVYYKVMNLGNVEAKLSLSKLYLDNIEKATDYLDAVPGGQEVTGVFHQYHLQVLEAGVTPDFPSSAPAPVKIKVCADVNDDVKESDELNNCNSIVLGFLGGFDFVEQAHQAVWRSGAGLLKWPMVASDSKGAAFLSKYALEDDRSYPNALAMYPQQVPFGVIQGTFGEPVTKQYGMEAQTREFVVPQKAKFSAKVGLRKDASKTDGATVSFGIMDPSGSLVVLRSLKVVYDGMLDVVEADLGALAGQKVFFVLRVEAGPSWEDDYVVWIEPVVIQEQ